jgi:UDP-N-acetyl-D-mannosaminuronic acid transferase (WecB/TagA/CpsF family)
MSYFFSGSLSTDDINIEKSGGIVFQDSDASNKLTLQAPTAITSNFSLTLPNGTGSNGQVLKTDGSGNLSFTDQASGAGGSDTQLQYNNGGSLGGIAEFTYNDSSKAIAIDTSSSNATFTVNTGSAEIDLTTTGTLDINAGTLDMDLTTLDMDLTDSSAITITSSEAGEDLTIEQVGANDSSIIITAAGTGTDAIKLNASAGGVDIDAAATKDVNIAGGQVALVSKDDAASAISLTANQGTSETIVVTNTQGTAAGAITLTATAGGVDVDAAAAKDVNIAGGQVALVSKDNATSAISLTTDVGITETIVVTNTQGTAAGAITLTATAGGVDIDAAAAKDVNIAGGQVALVSKDDAASAISLTANQGTSETIVVTNTQGTAEGAITLTASAGGVDIDAADGKDVNIAGGQVALVSKDNAASAISLTANQGTSETIVVTNTQGTGSGAIALTATAGGITLNGALVTKVNTLTVADTSALNPHQLISTTNNTVFLDLTEEEGSNNAVIEVAGSNTAGQHLNLFFDNAGSNTLTLNFGGTNLTSGSGTARTLTFSQTGQSASLMYVGSKWRIINTGAAVA